jgi:hypothetical protein
MLETSESALTVRAMIGGRSPRAQTYSQKRTLGLSIPVHAVPSEPQAAFCVQSVSVRQPLRQVPS